MYYIDNLIGYINNLEPLIRALVSISIILIGWLIAALTKKVVITFLGKLNLNQAIKRLGWQKALDKAGCRIDGQTFFGKIVEWTIFIIFLMIAFEITGMDYISVLLGKVVGYLPNIIIASLIFIAAIFLSDFSHRIVVASTNKKVSWSRIIGDVFRVFVWIFASLAILLQLGIAPDIIKAIIYGFIFMVALAGGLAFGLGGKDFVSKFLEKIKNNLS